MWEITFRIKEFCSSQSTSDFLLCEMSTVLRGLFFLMLNCLFGCFVRILVLSVEDRCHLTALIRHLHFGDQYQYFVKHRKDGFYRKKKNRPLRTVTFHHMKINALRLLQNFLTNLSPTSQSYFLHISRKIRQTILIRLPEILNMIKNSHKMFLLLTTEK